MTFKTRNEGFNKRVMVWICPNCGTWFDKSGECNHCQIKTLYFASKAEAKRYAELKLLEKMGKICKLQTQVSFPLRVSGDLIANYRADFVYEDLNDNTVVEDVKANNSAAVLTGEFKIKQKLMKAIYNIDVRLVSGAR